MKDFSITTGSMRLLNRAISYLMLALNIACMQTANAGEDKSFSKLHIIAGVAISENGKPKKIDIASVLQDVESQTGNMLDHFAIDEVFGYGESNGKFWIIVSGSAPPLTHSSAYTLYTRLLSYKKNKVEIRDVTMVEIKKLKASTSPTKS